MTYGYNSLTPSNYQNAYSSQPDIQIPKNVQQSLGLRQIKDFDAIENFQDANGKNWRLVKRSTDSSIEIPDPQYLQVSDYWCHEFPGSSPKTFIYVVEGIKHPRENEETSQKTSVLYQWFSTTEVKNFTPQMISQSEWHRANVYSSELVDARMSKFIALCKLCKPGTSKPILENPSLVKEEYIEDICLEVGTGPVHGTKE